MKITTLKKKHPESNVHHSLDFLCIILLHLYVYEKSTYFFVVFQLYRKDTDVCNLWGLTFYLCILFLRFIYIVCFTIVYSFFVCLFVYLAESVLRCGTRDLVPWPGIELGPSTLGVQILDTGPPGKSLVRWFLTGLYIWVYKFTIVNSSISLLVGN